VAIVTPFVQVGRVPLKIQFPSQTRREQKIAPPHLIYMQEVIFCEQRGMATEIGFLA
jgi:hypothetical protein